MIQWVYERSCKARGVDSTWVATEDSRIADCVEGFGGRAILTSDRHTSGTDRIAEAALKIPADIYVNVQGDEPLIEARAIESAVSLVASGRFQMATVMTPFQNLEEVDNLHVVKVIADHEGRAIYFSRFPIPYSRGSLPPEVPALACRRHVGLYVYTREVLHRLTRLPPSALELGESLEQLRAMQAGISIGISEIEMRSIGVDVAEDLHAVRNILTSGEENKING